MWSVFRLARECWICGRVDGLRAHASASFCNPCAASLRDALLPRHPSFPGGLGVPVLAAALYRDAVAAYVRLVKSQPAGRLATPLRHGLVEFLEHWRCELLEFRASHIVPVPSDPWRTIQRTDLSSELAKLAGQVLGTPVAWGALRKRLWAPQQKTLGGGARRRQLRLRGSDGLKRLAGQRVLLIDDVATTGATLAEAVERLRRAGAKPVGAWVLARSETFGVSWAHARMALPDDH